MGKTVACLVLDSPLVDGMLTRNGSQVTVRQPYRCCYVFILAYGRTFLVNLNIYEIIIKTLIIHDSIHIHFIKKNFSYYSASKALFCINLLYKKLLASSLNFMCELTSRISNGSLFHVYTVL